MHCSPAARALMLALALLGLPGLGLAQNKTDKSYPFAVLPVKALDRLGELEKVSGQKITISQDERRLFADAADGKLDRWSFAEAALLASGITEAPRRQAYLAKIDALEKEARTALDGAKTTAAKGEKLLKFLHAQTLAPKGYSALQTDVHVVLDTGKFNCVSSATLYNILAGRLGFKVRAMELPGHHGHVFSVLYDGDQSFPVETTTPHGFNPGRDKSLRDHYKELGIPYLPEMKSKDKREIDEFQLVAVTYANHAPALGKQQRFHEALAAALCACCLDRDSVVANNNCMAALGFWKKNLCKAGQFEDAAAVAVFALKLGPKNETLQKQASATYDEWARSYFKKDWDAAIDIYKAGLKQLPESKLLAQNRKYCEQERERSARK